MEELKTIQELYARWRKSIKQGEARRDYLSSEVADVLWKILEKVLAFLNNLEIEELCSRISGKSYFRFVWKRGSERSVSRAFNMELFILDGSLWKKIFQAIEEENWTEVMNCPSLEAVFYSWVAGFCASIDILKKARDQKTPGTFFENLVAFLMARRLELNPITSLPIYNIDEENMYLTTDFIFNLGRGKPKFHVPVKLSSRERAIMLWAHQKLLNGVYGMGRFIGIPVIFSETKTDARTAEVEEICVPQQWNLYQTYISQLKRIYYFDLPAVYVQQEPRIPIKKFTEFFKEYRQLVEF